MRVHVAFVIGAVLGVFALAVGAAGAETSENLIRNPAFTLGEGDTVRHWTIWKPAWERAACVLRRTDGGLLVSSPAEPYGVGGARQRIDGIEGGQAYAARAACKLTAIGAPRRCVTVRLAWLKGKKQLHPAGWLVRGPVVKGGAATFEDVFVAPPEADAAQLTLEIKWPGAGSVLWKRVSLRRSEPPAPRKVKIGTVYLRPRRSTPEKNLDLWCAQIDAAGKLALDIVCLGEVITKVGTDSGLSDVAKPIPGPDTERLGEAARRNTIWVVAGLTERDGKRVYNTAVLIDRQGRLAGTYRKVHLPREEWKKGITPGTGYPVFKTDFGRVAMMICYDWFFPEAAEAFALRGAEILFAPTWGNTLPDEDGRVDGETTFRVRARDNGLVIVPSVYDGQSMVIDPMGRILAANAGKTGLFWAEVDLAQRQRLRWVGHWGSIGPRDRMPETYGPLMEIR
jgi:predicted amidohydrolase